MSALEFCSGYHGEAALLSENTGSTARVIISLPWSKTVRTNVVAFNLQLFQRRWKWLEVLLSLGDETVQHLQLCYSAHLLHDWQALRPHHFPFQGTEKKFAGRNTPSLLAISNFVFPASLAIWNTEKRELRSTLVKGIFKNLFATYRHQITIFESGISSQSCTQY